MTGPIFQRGTMARVGRGRSFPVRPGAAALALSAALAAAGAAAHQVHWSRPDAGQAVTAGTSIASRTVLAGGRNTTGQLGDGRMTDSANPVRVRLPRHAKVTAVSAGQYFSLARTTKGRLLAWGDNDGGELGDGSTASSDTPVRVDLPGGWRASAVGSGPMAAHALAIVHKKGIAGGQPTRKGARR
jgi:Regulator of chromosome condensation (RCC1) repeat